MTKHKSTLLKLNNVHASYGPVQALEGVSLNVLAGEIVILIGPHGTGKTTILKVICGLLPVTSGEIHFNGQCLNGLSTEKLISLGIAYVDERKLLFPSMSVIDNLILGAYHRYKTECQAIIEKDIQDVFQLFPIIKERTEQTAGTLSGGEQQMLAIGRALMAKPKLLLLDCPSLGLAPLLVTKMAKAITKLKDQGIAVLIVEQNIPVALSIADRGYIMGKGKIASEGLPEELLAMQGMPAIRDGNRS